MFDSAKIQILPEILSLIAEIDEFKGAWRAFGTLAPERLSALRRVATIESIGSSTRIEGSQLSDREVERLLANLEIQSFASRDEQEVAGYAAVMETLFHAWQDIPVTENHIKQLHRDLLQFSLKDDRHRGEYKKLPNNVAAFDDDGKQIAIVFETATPFDTPPRMAELVEWLHTEQELMECTLRRSSVSEREQLRIGPGEIGSSIGTRFSYLMIQLAEPRTSLTLKLLMKRVLASSTKSRNCRSLHRP
jgi:Fic family protein